MRRGARKTVALALGLVVTVAALALAMREANLRDTLAALRAYRYGWLVPAVAVFYYSMYVRAVRWGLLFAPERRLSGRDVFAPLMICFAFNSLLPARVGEFARAWLVGRARGTGFAAAMATVVGERLLDSVTLLGMLAWALAVLPPLDPSLQMRLGDVVIDAALVQAGIRALMIVCAVLTLAVAAMMAPPVQRRMQRAVRRLPLPERFGGRLERLLMQFTGGFGALRHPPAMVRIVLLSLAVWLLLGISNILAARGFGIVMTLTQSLALAALVGIAILPSTTPGYWGLYELGAVYGMKFMGIGADDSQRMACALLIHMLQFVPIVVVGLYYAVQANVRPADVIEARPEDAAVR